MPPEVAGRRLQRVLDAVVGLLHDLFRRKHRLTHPDQMHRLLGQQVELRALRVGQRSRPPVENAQRAERQSPRVDDGGAGIEAERVAADAQRVVERAPVRRRILDDQRPDLQDRVGADRLLDRRLGQDEAVARLEPLPRAVDQRDQRHRRLAQLRGKADEGVELRLFRGVQDAVAREALKSRAFQWMRVCLHVVKARSSNFDELIPDLQGRVT